MKAFGSYLRTLVVGLAALGLTGCQLNNSGPAPSPSPAPGALSVPSALSFSKTQVGSNQKQTLNVSNTGGGTALISKATVTGSSFSVSGQALPLSIQAGQTLGFTVTFTPTAVGNVTSTLTFTTDLPGTQPQVSLSGSAVSAGVLGTSPASLNFGTVLVGANQNQTVTLSNTGGTALTISQVAASGVGFSVTGVNLPLTLIPGQTSSFQVTFAPTSAANYSGTITVTHDQGTATVSLSGTGVAAGALTAAPSSLSFGSVQVGSKVTKSVTVANSGGQSVTISQASVSGNGYSISGIATPLTVAAKQSFTFSVVFAPAVAGSANGTVSLASDASNPNLAIACSGLGTAPGQLTVTPSLDFGSVLVGSNKSLTSTLSATNAGVTVSSASSNSPEFTVSGLTLPVTLAAGQSKSFTVTFTPQTSGAASGSLSFVSDAANSPATEAVAGTGTVPIAHSVDLSWVASTSTIAGYYVYRGTKSGGPYTRISPVPDVSTSYTDGNVQSGQTYYYVVTAVDNKGTESVHSNEVPALIPVP